MKHRCSLAHKTPHTNPTAHRPQPAQGTARTPQACVGPPARTMRIHYAMLVDMGPWDLGVHATRNQLLYMHTHTTEACVLPEGYLASSGRGRAVLGEIALWPRASRDTTGVLSSIVMAVGVAIETWPSAVAGVLPGGRPSPLPRLSTQASRRAHRRFGCRWR